MIKKLIFKNYKNLDKQGHIKIETWDSNLSPPNGDYLQSMTVHASLQLDPVIFPNRMLRILLCR